MNTTAQNPVNVVDEYRRDIRNKVRSALTRNNEDPDNPELVNRVSVTSETVLCPTTVDGETQYVPIILNRVLLRGAPIVVYSTPLQDDFGLRWLVCFL